MSSIIFMQSNDIDIAGFESGTILTVVDSAVLPGTFRPPYMGNAPQWRSWIESTINYDAFADFTPTGNAPIPTD